MGLSERRMLKITEPENNYYRQKLLAVYADWVRYVQEERYDEKGAEVFLDRDFLPYFFLCGDQEINRYYRNRYHSFIKALALLNYPGEDEWFVENCLLGKIVWNAAKVLDWSLDTLHSEIVTAVRPGYTFGWESILFNFSDEKLDDNFDCYHVNGPVLNILELSDHFIDEMFHSLMQNVQDKHPMKAVDDILLDTEPEIRELLSMRLEEFLVGKRKINSTIFQIWGLFGKKKRRLIYPNMQRLVLMRFGDSWNS